MRGDTQLEGRVVGQRGTWSKEVEALMDGLKPKQGCSKKASPRMNGMTGAAAAY